MYGTDNITSTLNDKNEIHSTSSSSHQFPLCSTTVDELLNEHLINSRLENCPMCHHPSFKHPRSVLSVQSSFPSVTHTVNREALKSLPKWKIDFKQSRSFLDRMEQIFFAANLPSSEYTKQLLLSVTDVEEANYIKDNIIDKGLDWDQARIVFQNHFDVFNVVEQNEADYEKIRKLPRETVQHYSDRYLNLCSVLGIPDNDNRAIKHFVHGLDDKLQQDYKKTVNLARIVNNGINTYDLTSLRKIIALIISIELSNQSVPSYSSLSSPSTPQSKPLSSNQPSMCVYHPRLGVKHTTAECNNNPINRTPTTPTRNPTSLSTSVSPNTNNFSQSRVVSVPSPPLPVRSPTTNINNTNYTSSNNNSNKNLAYTPVSFRTRSQHQVASINTYQPLSSVSENDDTYIDNGDYNGVNDYQDQINNISNNYRLPDDIHEKCFRERLCFRCQQAGHISRECPSKNSYNQRQ
jgi:hypothetical protein